MLPQFKQTLTELFTSKKFLVVALALILLTLAHFQIIHLSVDEIHNVRNVIMAYLIGQGVADSGLGRMITGITGGTIGTTFAADLNPSSPASLSNDQTKVNN